MTRVLQFSKAILLGRHQAGSRLFALTLLVVPAFCEAAAATITLSERMLPVPIRGLQLAVPVAGEVRYHVLGDRTNFQGRATADLAHLQDRAPAVLAALFDQKQVCGEQLSVRDGRIGAREAALLIVATVDYARNACLAGRQMKILPRAGYHVEMLLRPLVGARSLRFQAEVVELRKQHGELPAALLEPLRHLLGTLVGERIGQLFPPSIPPEVSLKGLEFVEARPKRLAARLDIEGSVPRETFARLLEGR
jgi:hypothetical protein